MKGYTQQWPIGTASTCSQYREEIRAKPHCRLDGRCQYAIDSGAEGMAHCPEGKCVQPVGFGPIDGNWSNTALENWFPYSAEELDATKGALILSAARVKELESNSRYVELEAALNGLRPDLEKMRAWDRVFNTLYDMNPAFIGNREGATAEDCAIREIKEYHLRAAQGELVSAAAADLHDYLFENVPDLLDISTSSELAGEGLRKRLQRLKDVLKSSHTMDRERNG